MKPKFGDAITAVIYRQQRRGAIIWGSVFGMFMWVSAAGYAQAYPTTEDRATVVRTLGENTGIRSIFGPPRALDTVQGFTAWRSATSFVVIGAVWGLLLATKLLRGDEEAGRSDLLFAGPVTRASGLRAQLVGLGITWLVLFGTVASWFITIGVTGHYFSWTAAIWFALVSCSTASVFLAVGAATSQFASTRRTASTVAGALFGAALLTRAIAESVEGRHWLSWASPIGWVDRMHPLTGTNMTPMLLIVAAVAVAVTLAVVVASRRDLGQGVWPSRDTAEPATALLQSSRGLALRLLRGTTIAWAVGVGIFAAVFGIVSTAVSDAFKENSSVSDIFSRLGAELSAPGYVGVTFVFLGAALGITAAVFIGACRAEEAEGRLEYITALPVRRADWLLTRASIAAGSMVVLGLVAGVGGWIGVAVSGGDIQVGRMFLEGINVVPPGVLVLGVGTLAYGFFARSGSAVAYALVAWSFLVEMIGALVNLNHLVLDTSIIHHVAAVPAADPHWDASLAMLAVGCTCIALGAVALQRRDLQPG
jgi:ABC-2 type transport system permease protein